MRKEEEEERGGKRREEEGGERKRTVEEERGGETRRIKPLPLCLPRSGHLSSGSCPLLLELPSG